LYEFLFGPCVLRCLNYVWIFIWIMYFKVLRCLNYEWKKNFLTILRSEFILHFSCRVKNVFLTTLLWERGSGIVFLLWEIITTVISFFFFFFNFPGWSRLTPDPWTGHWAGFGLITMLIILITNIKRFIFYIISLS
jgi:hypothetical protein